MQDDQTNALRAALERAAATMRNSQPSFADRFGGMQPPSTPSPNQYVGQNFPQGMDPAALAKGDMQQASPDQAIANRGMPPIMAAGGGVPMPQPRPQMPMAPQAQAQAPQAPPQQPMGFFQRNAAMMQDPNGGGYIDPRGAARAQSQHQGIIPNIMGLFGPPQTNVNGGIRGAQGPTSVGGAPLAAPAQDQGGLIQKMLGMLNSRAG